MMLLYVTPPLRHTHRFLVHSLGGEGYLNFEGNEFGHPEVRFFRGCTVIGLTSQLYSGLTSLERVTETPSITLVVSGT